MTSPQPVSEVKHTPGPWRIDGGDGWIVRAGDRLVASAGGYESNVTYQGDENRANAALIAAAPDLLAACIVDDAIQRLGLTVEACEEIEKHGIVIDPHARSIRNIALGKWATAFRATAIIRATQAPAGGKVST